MYTYIYRHRHRHRHRHRLRHTSRFCSPSLCQFDLTYPKKTIHQRYNRALSPRRPHRAPPHFVSPRAPRRVPTLAPPLGPAATPCAAPALPELAASARNGVVLPPTTTDAAMGTGVFESRSSAAITEVPQRSVEVPGLGLVRRLLVELTLAIESVRLLATAPAMAPPPPLPLLPPSSSPPPSPNPASSELLDIDAERGRGRVWRSVTWLTMWPLV